MKIRFFQMMIMLFLVSGCLGKTGFENYRYNPFQFPYPEYYLKADKITHVPAAACIQNPYRLNLFGIKTTIDQRYFDELIKNKNKQSPLILKKNGEVVLWSAYHKEDLMGCDHPKTFEAHKDFCSAFKSSKEFNAKLFSLTADDLKNQTRLKDGDLWIIHRKGLIFQHTKAIYVYQLGKLTAFRQDTKKRKGEKVQLHIFPNAISPDSIEVVLAKTDENLVAQIISSMNMD